MGYLFRNLETDEIVELDVDFTYLMENQAANGCIMLHGIEHRRMIHLECLRDGMKTSDPVRKHGVTSRTSNFSLAVQPSQVKEAREYWRKEIGPGIDFAPDGSVTFEGLAVRQKMLLKLNETMGVVDKDSYY